MMGKKRDTSAKHNHWQIFLASLGFSLFMLLLIWLQIHYPFAIRQPLLRFLLYAFTMAIPSILTLALSLINPLKAGLPAGTYYVIAFLTYLSISHCVLHRHHHTSIDEKLLFRKKALVTILLVVLWFFAILTILYYR
jgi:hypothetical protein